jgi:hypothetical protein
MLPACPLLALSLYEVDPPCRFAHSGRAMCNHYANHPEIQKELSTWREFIGWSLNVPLPPELAELDEDVWPKREAAVVRDSVADGGAVADIMRWGVPLSLPGKRAGSVVTKHVTNVRNLDSPFWRGMLTKPEQRCLVPFTRFAEPKAGCGARGTLVQHARPAAGGLCRGVALFLPPPFASSAVERHQLDLTGSRFRHGRKPPRRKKRSSPSSPANPTRWSPAAPKGDAGDPASGGLCDMANRRLGGSPKAGAAFSEPVDGGRVRRGIKGDRE